MDESKACYGHHSLFKIPAHARQLSQCHACRCHDCASPATDSLQFNFRPFFHRRWGPLLPSPLSPAACLSFSLHRLATVRERPCEGGKDAGTWRLLGNRQDASIRDSRRHTAGHPSGSLNRMPLLMISVRSSTICGDGGGVVFHSMTQNEPMVEGGAAEERLRRN